MSKEFSKIIPDIFLGHEHDPIYLYNYSITRKSNFSSISLSYLINSHLIRRRIYRPVSYLYIQLRAELESGVRHVGYGLEVDVPENNNRNSDILLYRPSPSVSTIFLDCWSDNFLEETFFFDESPLRIDYPTEFNRNFIIPQCCSSLITIRDNFEGNRTNGIQYSTRRKLGEIESTKFIKCTRHANTNVILNQILKQSNINSNFDFRKSITDFVGEPPLNQEYIKGIQEKVSINIGKKDISQFFGTENAIQMVIEDIKKDIFCSGPMYIIYPVKGVVSTLNSDYQKYKKYITPDGNIDLSNVEIEKNIIPVLPQEELRLTRLIKNCIVLGWELRKEGVGLFGVGKESILYWRVRIPEKDDIHYIKGEDTIYIKWYKINELVIN